MSYPSDSLARTPSHPTLAPGPLLVEAVQRPRDRAAPASGGRGGRMRGPTYRWSTWPMR